MPSVSIRRCPCGAVAPDPLPEPGARPVLCPACATPLCLPPSDAALLPVVETALGGGIAAAAVLAVAWAGVAYATRTAAPWFIPLAAAAIAWAAIATSRQAGRIVRTCAVIAYCAFLAAGEVLQYRHALLVRLVAMHEAEGARGPEFLGEEERRRMGGIEYFLFECDGWWIGAAVLGLAIAWRMTRAPAAAAAFTSASTEPSSEPEPEPEPA